jgi:predicted PurR-regulated permease PerM
MNVNAGVTVEWATIGKERYCRSVVTTSSEVERGLSFSWDLLVWLSISVIFSLLPSLSRSSSRSSLPSCFYPVQAKIRHWVRNRNAGAALSTTTVILVVGALSFLIGRALVSGLHDIYDSLSGSGESRERLAVFIIQLFDRAISWASHYVPISMSNLQGALLSQVERAVASVLGATAGFVGSLSAFGLNTFIAIFVMFFLLRDGQSMSWRAADILPLRLRQARRLFSLVRET